MKDKPTVNLIGEDGNAFAILGAARRAARKAGWTGDEIEEYLQEAMSGDYNHLLATTCDYFNVV